MINVESAGIGVRIARVRIDPSAGKDTAAACVENRGSEALGNEDFLPGVLTVTVRVGPAVPVVAVIGW